MALSRGKRRNRSGAMVGVLGHQGLDLVAQLLGDFGRGRVRDWRRVLFEVDGVVPTGHARAFPALGDLVLGELLRLGAHRSIPPSTGSSIASVAIRSAM